MNEEQLRQRLEFAEGLVKKVDGNAQNWWEEYNRQRQRISELAAQVEIHERLQERHEQFMRELCAIVGECGPHGEQCMPSVIERVKAFKRLVEIVDAGPPPHVAVAKHMREMCAQLMEDLGDNSAHISVARADAIAAAIRALPLPGEPARPPVVDFCNWCPDPANPSPESHPGGQAEHVPVNIDPEGDTDAPAIVEVLK